MNQPEKQASEFYEFEFLNSGKFNSLENLKSSLLSKLYSFNRDRDKLDFLKVLQNTCVEDIKNHMEKCTGCGYDEERNVGLFAIEQEIDSINKYFVFEPNDDDLFTADQESKLHSKLNKIIEDLEKQGFGQQIIFEEIEELKNHFNLGKKTWFQILKGKLLDVAVETAIEKTAVKEIFDFLSDGYEQAAKMLNP